MASTRVCTYVRVSTRSQGDSDRLGLPTQQQAIKQLCTEQGFLVVAEYADIGCSGATAARKGLATLLDQASRGLFDAVVVAKLDRLARNLMLDGFIRYQLRKAGVRVISATEPHADSEDPVAALTANVLAAVAQFERHLIAQRMSSARALKRQRGGYSCGRPPYSRRASGKSLVVDECETAVVDFMKQLRSAGKSYGSIALSLEARAIFPRHATHWSRSTILRILRRNAGVHHFA